MLPVSHCVLRRLRIYGPRNLDRFGPVGVSENTWAAVPDLLRADCPKYSREELVGRWGYTSYQNEADKARTVNTARGLCRNRYVIARGPNGGVMMHLHHL